MADLNILDLLSSIAPVLGGAAKSNQTQNNFEDVTRQAAWNNLEQNKLARAKFAEAAPGQRLATSARASMTKNFTPTRVAWGGKGSGKRGEMPIYSGGAVDAAASPDPRTTQTANSVLDRELMAQLNGAAGADTAMSAQPPVAHESLGSKLLGGAAAGSALAAALKSPGGGGGSPSGGSADLTKLFKSLFGKGPSGDSGPQQDYGPENDPSWFDPADYGLDPDGNYGPPDPVASVDTSMEFTGVPGGYPGNPEDPMSVDPEWWQLLSGGGGAPAPNTGTDWWDE